VFELKRCLGKSFFAASVAACAALAGPAWLQADAPAQPDPAFWTWASKPPMGWNSFDCFGDSVTEGEFLANALYLRERLYTHGFDTMVVDYRWYDPGAHSGNLRERAGASLASDDSRHEPSRQRRMDQFVA
jgi:hypothetical protein